jgi:predicted tellurium resistance membrane protein TerC
LPKEQQSRARKLGLLAALGTRILLLFTLTFIMGLSGTLFTMPELPFLETPEARDISWKDLILIAGGLFLIGKSTREIHDKLEGDDESSSAEAAPAKPPSFGWTLAQIAVIDIVFSLDSVVTAVGMAREVWVMVAAMTIAVGVMMFFAGRIADFVAKHPTLKMLALSFLILIGFLLVVEGFGKHVDKGYVYFAMAFSFGVELLNLRAARSKGHPVGLHERKMPAG